MLDLVKTRQNLNRGQSGKRVDPAAILERNLLKGFDKENIRPWFCNAVINLPDLKIIKF